MLHGAAESIINACSPMYQISPVSRQAFYLSAKDPDHAASRKGLPACCVGTFAAANAHNLQAALPLCSLWVHGAGSADCKRDHTMRD